MHPASSSKAREAPGSSDPTSQSTAGSGSISPGAARVSAADTTEPQNRPLTPEAQRALAEAEERRRRRDQQLPADGSVAKELGGREGPDPARYGDWENGGIASDF